MDRGQHSFRALGGDRFALAFGLAVIGLFAAIAWTCDEKPKTSPAVVPAAPPTAKTSTRSFGIGETVAFPDSDWTLLRVTDHGKLLLANTIRGREATTQGRFLLVNFRVLNKTLKQQRLRDHPKLVDSRGREFEKYDDQWRYIPRGAKELTGEALPPSLAREFWALYEVPLDATQLRLGLRGLGTEEPAKFITLEF